MELEAEAPEAECVASTEAASLLRLARNWRGQQKGGREPQKRSIGKNRVNVSQRTSLASRMVPEGTERGSSVAGVVATKVSQLKGIMKRERSA